MEALVLEGPKRLIHRKVEPHQNPPESVVIDVEVTGIGGSEYLGYNNPGMRPLPNIMGHGFAGKTASGERVAVYPLGGCGTCDYCHSGLQQLCSEWRLIGVHTPGGFAQQAIVPSDALVPLPEDMGWEQATFIEPFANAVNAWALAEASSDASVAVIGLGGLGLGVVACAASAGCRLIEAYDLSQSRINAAVYLGATAAAPGEGKRYDVVFDTVGSGGSRNQALALTRKGGKCVLLGFATASLELNAFELIRGQKQLLGSFVYSRDQFKSAIPLAQRCPSEWVRNLTFEQVEPQLRRYLNADFDTVRAALRPQWR